MPLSGNTGGSASSNYARIICQKPQGVDNGSVTAFVWTTLDLTTITHNEGNIASLAANVITLIPGVYRVWCLHGGDNISTNRIRLRDTTNAINYLGMNVSTPNGNDTKSQVAYTITLTSATNFELQLYTATTRLGTGLGEAINLNGVTELYTLCEFIQIGTA